MRKNSKQGVLANAQESFTINTSSQNVLIFSTIRFTTKELNVANQTNAQLSTVDVTTVLGQTGDKVKPGYFSPIVGTPASDKNAPVSLFDDG